MPPLYRRHSIWRQIANDRAVRYICFERLSDGVFTVQSCDHFSLPVDREARRQHAEQAIELFIETDPVERFGSFSTLIEAINAFDVAFQNEQDFAESSSQSAAP